jgi:hypothetical protein
MPPARRAPLEVARLQGLAPRTASVAHTVAVRPPCGPLLSWASLPSRVRPYPTTHHEGAPPTSFREIRPRTRPVTPRSRSLAGSPESLWSGGEPSTNRTGLADPRTVQPSWGSPTSSTSSAIHGPPRPGSWVHLGGAQASPPATRPSSDGGWHARARRPVRPEPVAGAPEVVVSVAAARCRPRQERADTTPEVQSTPS